MSGLSPGGPRSALAGWFPLPLVGAAVLLAVLIVLTPNLLSTGSPSAGSVESQLELLVDRAPSGDPATHVYLRGLGLVRYSALEIAWTALNGSAPASLAGIAWTHVLPGGTGLALEANVTADAFALNVSAVFVDTSGAGVLYDGTYAFVWSGGLLVTTAYGAASGAGPTAPAQLPLILFPPETPLSGSP